MTTDATTPRARTVTCVGFDWRTEVSLKETLSLLHGKTRDTWEYSDELTADVVVYEPTNALAQALVRQQGHAGTRVFYPSTSTDETQLTLRPPFGASRLIRCLDAASDRLRGGPAQERAEATTLSQRLDDALRAPGVVGVALGAADQSGLLIPHDLSLAWSAPMTMDSIAQLLTGDVQVRVLGQRDVAQMQNVRAIATRLVNAESLLWAIGVTRSRGVLLRRLKPTQAYKLRRWPNFGLLGRRPADLRCCSVLIHRALTAAELATASGIPIGMVHNFLNACALSGLVETVAATVSAPLPAAPRADSGFSTVFRRIRHALTLD